MEEKPQHLQALDKANDWRLKRAKLKRRVKEGDLLPEEVIAEPPEYAVNMTLAELLRSQDRWGRTRTRKFLVVLAVNENRKLGRLTLRQRQQLANELQAKREKSNSESARNQRKRVRRRERAARAEREAISEDMVHCPGCGCEVQRKEVVASLFGRCNRCESGQLAKTFGPGPEEGPANGGH